VGARRLFAVVKSSATVCARSISPVGRKAIGSRISGSKSCWGYGLYDTYSIQYSPAGVFGLDIFLEFPMISNLLSKKTGWVTEELNSE